MYKVSTTGCAVKLDHMMCHRLQEAYDNYNHVYKTIASKKRSVHDGRYDHNKSSTLDHKGITLITLLLL